jgi:hypothetical protein
MGMGKMVSEQWLGHCTSQGNQIYFIQKLSMSYQTVLPVKRSGGWSGFHRIYYTSSINTQIELESKKAGPVEMHRLLVEEE